MQRAGGSSAHMQTHAADLEELLQPDQPQVGVRRAFAPQRRRLPEKLICLIEEMGLFFFFCLFCVFVWRSDSGRGSSLLDRAIADRRQLNAMSLPDFSDPETGTYTHTHTHIVERAEPALV